MQKNLSAAEQKRLFRFQFEDEKHLVRKSKEGELMKFCPRVGCNFGAFICKEAEKFACALCGWTICPQCDKAPHVGKPCAVKEEMVDGLGF